MSHLNLQSSCTAGLEEAQESLAPIAEATPPELVQSEIEALSDSCIFAQDRRFSVFVSESDRIPNVLREICRSREIAFREVGEGTGREIDRDQFDDFYLHAVLWDHENSALAGGYRIGLTDSILRTHGPDGLYCFSLFQFEPEFLDFLNQGIEVGRSFVAKDYQKMMQPLALLWRGVGHFLVAQKSYRYLFGPVSISQNYTNISKHLIVEYMRREKSNPRFSPLVKPRNAFEPLTRLQKSRISDNLTTIQEVSARIAETEPDGKGIPVLLKHYLKLNATVLNFNVDADFSNSLDALILVDTTQIPKLLLKKYFGEAGVGQLYRRET